jgi:uncharacterized protein (TIGR03083 family)
VKRDEAILRLRAARRELQDALNGLQEEDFLRANAINKWTLKDLMAHIASWDEEMLRVLQAFAMQTNPVFSYSISDRNDFAAWNEQQIAERRERTLEQVVAEFDGARRDLIQVAEGLTDPVLQRSKMTSWGSPATGFELLETQIGHDLEHAGHVRSYRKKIERWARARNKLSEKRRTPKKE